MPDWLSFEDPLVRKVVYSAVGLIVLVLVVRFWQRLREQAAAARRRKQLRETYGHVQLRQQEIRRLSDKIIATSSTATIAGFQLVRQIEAVFTDGHRSPADAVDALKALAARKGANALLNLGSQRLPSGKCVASADAVIVRPADGPPGPTPPQETSPETPT